MRKIIYLARHSIVDKDINNDLNIDSLQLRNEKSTLSIEGEKLAEKVSDMTEFKNIDLVVSSSYVRAQSTAKYFARNNNCKVFVMSLFNERKHGVVDWNELPENFERKQFEDFDFKMSNGESLNEVKKRLLEGLEFLLNSQYEKVLVISHATAITSLLTIWCQYIYGKELKYKDKVLSDAAWDYLDIYKLEFENNVLVNICKLGIDR